MEPYPQIFESDLPAIDKLRQGFDWVTRQYLESYQHEVDIMLALKDEDGLVKAQIKLEMTRTTRAIFNDCYFRSVGKQAWYD